MFDVKHFHANNLTSQIVSMENVLPRKTFPTTLDVRYCVLPIETPLHCASYVMNSEVLRTANQQNCFFRMKI